MDYCIRFGEGCKVCLYTCGYEKLGLWHPAHYETAEQFEYACGAAISNKLERRAYLGPSNQEELRGWSQADFALAYHCMNLGDPACDDSFRLHFGGNSLIMKRMLEATESRAKLIAHLRRLKQRCRRLRRGRRSNIALVCRSGRHRSVCLAFFLKWCLVDDGFDVTDIVHVNKDLWKKMCTTCVDCREDSSLKADIQKDVLSLWRGL